MATKDKPKIVVIPKPLLLPKVLNGGIAGIVGMCGVFPLDLVKTRLQNQPVGPGGEKQYKSILDCFRKTYAKEGFFGMYRGMAVNGLFVFPEKAVKLSSNDMFRYYLTLPDGTLPLWRQMVAGGGAGACQMMITTPMELLKIQMQDAGRLVEEAKKQGKVFVPKSALQITKDLLRERGFLGLYNGLGATGLRDIIFAVVYFPTFFIMNDMGPRRPGSDTSTFWWSFLSGCVAGMVSALSVTPFDVVKTRTQSLTKGAAEREYSTIITSTLKNEGITAFFKGGACRVMVLAPLYGIAQTVYYIGIAEWLLGIPHA